MTEAETVAEVAGRLDDRARCFLRRVCAGQKLRLADREEDRARQKCRRLGLVEVVMNPRRWIARPLGLAIRAYLESHP